jgi:CHAT domain-containing protein/tetratricopeptide (TPR) repeat protein
MAGILTYNLSHVSAPALVISVLLLAVQCGPHPRSIPNAHADKEPPPELRNLLRRGNAYYRSGEYLRAIQIYESGYREATRLGIPPSALKFLNNSGSAHYEMFHYRDATQAYLQARDLATVQGNQEMLVSLCFNLSSLYYQMGDVEAARESAEQGLKLLGQRSHPSKAQLLIHYAKVRRQQKDPGPVVVALLKDAIEVARAQQDAATEAQGLDVLGNTLLEHGQLAPAEHALLEALQLRESTHDDHVYYSYGALGYLRQAQGDLPSAAALFDKAVKSVGTASPSALWRAYYDRGQVKLAQARLDEAFADFGAALKSATQWRAEVLPADAFRISTEVTLDQVYSSFVEVGSRLYAQTGQKRFVEQSFAAAEDGRAASLRALWAGRDLTKTLPAEYWEALADLNKLEAGLVSGKPAVDMPALRRLRLKVEELEARAALDLPHDQGSPDPANGSLLERTRKTLRPTEAYLGFHLGTDESCLWVISREGFEFLRLPPRAYFAENVARLVKAVRENSPEAVRLGNRLYSQIFGPSRILADKPTWILAPDGPLFEMPFAALVQAVHDPGGTPLYVVERHALQIVPGVSAVFPTPGGSVDGPVIGVGDPIYNRADLRLPRRQSGPVVPVRAMELARLVGSGREIESCARIWRSEGYQPILLQGEAATRANVMEALRRKPAVLHLAAHVLFPNQDSTPGMVALSLTPAGELELLGANEIASLRLNLGLVVLNGCSSGNATILPGAGLMGMTRAWLGAGARAVIVTRWATADQNDGELFQSFYQRLSSFSDSTHRKSFAQSLQEAQVAELHAGGRRANPANWAAYFCVERN